MMIFEWSSDNTLQIGYKIWRWEQRSDCRYRLLTKHTGDIYWWYHSLFNSIEELEEYIVDEVFDERQKLVNLAIEQFQLKYGAK